jgi:two-component system chemotaxis sensor kinase CheA
MTDEDITALVFLPGFSTAERITNVSGRGVGMDVVRTNIEKIGGSIELRTERKRGTTVVIKIPLTLAIKPALSVTTGGHRYAIPQINLLELIRLEAEEASTAIQKIHDAPVFRLRNDLLPLVYLHERLRIPSRRAANDPLFIAVLQAEDREFGLVVDTVEDTQEIVVKPLQKQLSGIDVFAGATVFGDGSVSLIIDVAELSQTARRRAAVETSVAAVATTHARMLITNIGAHRRLAVPLAGVTRLEQLPASALEKVGDREMLQYHGTIIPMARIADIVNDSQPGQDDEWAPLQVVVYRRGERTVGLVVNEILDIVDEANISADLSGAGVERTLVIGDRITELLDVSAAILAADPDFFADETAGAAL